MPQARRLPDFTNLASLMFVLTLVTMATRRTTAAEPSVVSPNSKVEFKLFGAPAQLRYRIKFNGQLVISPSELQMQVDGSDLCRGAAIQSVESYAVDERYPTRGVHSQAIDHCRGIRIGLRHTSSGTNYLLEVRAYDNGVAFRHVIPEHGGHVPDEAHRFTIPAGSTVWYHDMRGHYEGVHTKRKIEEIEAGDWCAPPVTYQLPDGTCYASITEGALIGYSGMALQADGRGALVARLGHSQPVSYPFELRYGADEARRLAQPAVVSGPITTPWRIVIVGADLNTLVNCDIVSNVSPPPDKDLFPEGVHTAWLKPGRCVWRYLDGGDATLEGMKEFSRLAAQLGFEYNLLEGFWRRWSRDDLRELVDYSRERGVGILLWCHSGRLRTPEARRELFDLCHDVGVAGVKIDFFDHEARELVDLYPTMLKEAAQRHLIVDFHGANKPTGEWRTWPNEMTREAVAGMERRRLTDRATHDTTLPFTRYLAGPADYTPVHFGDRRGNTTWAHQIATAAVFTSPLLVYAAHPKHLLEDPAAEVIKSIPSTWDETIALPQCEIGKLAAFARRMGNVWFLVVLNGAEPQTIEVPLDFLTGDKYQTSLVHDGSEGPTSLVVEHNVATAGDSMTIHLAAGGGFVGRFDPRRHHADD
jgi:alpha-glucosidase